MCVAVTDLPENVCVVILGPDPQLGGHMSLDFRRLGFIS